MKAVGLLPRRSPVQRATPARATSAATGTGEDAGIERTGGSPDSGLHRRPSIRRALVRIHPFSDRSLEVRHFSLAGCGLFARLPQFCLGVEDVPGEMINRNLQLPAASPKGWCSSRAGGLRRERSEGSYTFAVDS